MELFLRAWTKSTHISRRILSETNTTQSTPASSTCRRSHTFNHHYHHRYHHYHHHPCHQRHHPFPLCISLFSQETLWYHHHIYCKWPTKYTTTKRYTIPHFLLAFLAIEAVAQGNAGLTQASRCSNTSVVKLPMNLRAGWQKLHGSTGGTRRIIWTQTKILSQNIRYFVAN